MLVLLACDETASPLDGSVGLEDADPRPDAELEADAGPDADADAGAGAALDAGTDVDAGSLDGGLAPPVPCAELSDEALQAHGYEPVRAHGAVGDGVADDTAAIQAAIDEANRVRRSVYFHPGEYLVSDTLEVRQDIFDTRGNDSTLRQGMTLLGSYCGERPTLRLADGVAPETDEAVVSAEPLPLLLLMRDVDSNTAPDDSHGARDWNQVVRNLHLVLGDNPGAVGIRHHGAEGSSAQEVSVDARGGFAGFYHLNCSGGYTYDIEVRGGRYGLYLPSFRGGSAAIIGLTLHEQEVTPLAFDHYAPLTVVGFDIRHDGGRVISSISGNEGSYSVPGELRRNGDAGGHLALVDGTIDVAGGDEPALANTDRSVYLSGVWVRGAATILRNRDMGDLDAAEPSGWSSVGEYSVGGPSRWVEGEDTSSTFHDGELSAAAATISVAAVASSPPADLLTRHLYERGLCNVEAGDNVFVADHGADPEDDADDTAAIQAAIDAAEASGSNRVFLSAAEGASDGTIPGRYRISDTLRLGAETRLCGVSRYASILDATGWTPSADAPVISTPDDAAARPAIADFLIYLPTVEGDAIGGFSPHPYALQWRSGRGSLYRDVFYRSDWGEPGPRRMVHVEGGGGGRWYGITQQGSYPPALVGDGRPYRDSSGRLMFSPESTHMDISGTTEPLTFYGYHCQHALPPQGALTWIRDAANVTFYGVKSEMGTAPSRMVEVIRGNAAEDTPVWMFIRRSSNVRLIGHESHAQVARGRALIEITDSSEIRIVHYGRRSAGSLIPDDEWYFFEDDEGARVAASGFVSFYLSE